MNDLRMTYHESGYCEFPADLERVAEVSALLKRFCQRQCLDETLWPQIDLVFCECLNNAVEHGCHEDPTKIVKASWTWADDCLALEVEDPGAYQDVETVQSLPENPLEESGRGFFIIGSIAQSHKRTATAYGQKVTVHITTHPPSDVMQQMEDMYSLLQTFSNDLNTVYAERDTIMGFTEDIARCPVIEGIIESGIARLNGIVEIKQVNVWTLVDDHRLENAFHDGPEPLAIREAVIAPDVASPCSTAIATETEQFVGDCSLLRHDDPVHADDGVALVCPILYQKVCLGALALHCSEEHREVLLRKLLPLVKVFSQFLGLAYTSAKTYKQREEQEKSQTQLEIAAEIQRSLLPSSYPDNRYCRATGRCVAAMAVGGDYIDAIEIRDAGLLIVIADVMGKGVPAALLATIFRTAIRSRLNLAETPGWLLSQINKQIHKELGHLNMFITAQAAFLTYDKQMLKLACAGHCPALLLKPDSSETVALAAEGMPLGIDPNDLYEERLIKMESGSRVLFLTDGIYEAENPRGEMLGIDRLASSLPGLWKDGLSSVPDHTFKLAETFAQGKAAADDQTLLALEIL